MRTDQKYTVYCCLASMLAGPTLGPGRGHVSKNPCNPLAPNPRPLIVHNFAGDACMGDLKILGLSQFTSMSVSSVSPYVPYFPRFQLTHRLLSCNFGTLQEIHPEFGIPTAFIITEGISCTLRCPLQASGSSVCWIIEYPPKVDTCY